MLSASKSTNFSLSELTTKLKAKEKDAKKQVKIQKSSSTNKEADHHLKNMFITLD